MSSRRQFICSIAAGVALTVPLVTRAAQSDATSIKSLGLRMIAGSNDESFFALVTNYFPGLEKNRYFRAMARYAMLVINDGATPLSGITVSWSISRNGQLREDYQRRYMRRANPLKPGRTSSAVSPILRAGDVALITPLCIWKSKNYISSYVSRDAKSSPLGAQRWGQLKERFPRGTGLLQRTLAEDAVRCQVDAIVVGGEVMGSDRTSTARAVRYHQNAEHDEAKSLFNSATLSSGQMDLEKLNAAISRSIWLGAVATKRRTRPYAFARAAYAKRIRTLINRGKVADAARVLAQSAAAGRSRITV